MVQCDIKPGAPATRTHQSHQRTKSRAVCPILARVCMGVALWAQPIPHGASPMHILPPELGPCGALGRNPSALPRIQVQGLLKFTFSTQHPLPPLAPEVCFLSTFGSYRRHRTILRGTAQGQGAGAKAKATGNRRHARKISTQWCHTGDEHRMSQTIGFPSSSKTHCRFL